MIKSSIPENQQPQPVPSNLNPGTPLVKNSQHTSEQISLDATYDHIFQTQNPTQIMMGGNNSNLLPWIECWVHPQTQKVLWIQWNSELAKKAESDADFVQMFFYQLPKWYNENLFPFTKKIHYPLQSKNTFVTISFHDHLIQIN